MRRCSALIIVLALSALMFAQGSKQGPSQGAARQAGAALPTKATVDSFLRHVFGWDKDVSWTVTSIAASPAAGIAEVALEMKTTQKSGAQKLYVLPSRKKVVHGEMFPFGGQPAPAKPSDTAINDFVRQMTRGNPGITWTIAEVKLNAVDGLSQVTTVLTTPQGRGGAMFYVSRDGQHALVGEVSPFGADPYAAARAELARGVNGPARGPANAPVTVVEFADLQCPSCKSAAPIVERLLTDVPNLRFVFQQFPLVQIHKWAFKASTFADCVARDNNAAGWKFIQNVYAVQEQINETNAEQKLSEAATQAGADAAKTAACAALPATAARINQSVELGKAMGVQGTPTLYVGGRQISNVSGMPYDALKKMTEFMGTAAAKQEAANKQPVVKRAKSEVKSRK